MKWFEKHFIIILFDIFFDIYFLTDDSQLFFFKLHSIYFFIRSYKESSSEYSYIKRKNKKSILNEKKLKIKNQVIKFVNNTKSILVAQNFLNAVADTIDIFYKCPPLHSVKNFRVFPDILALSFSLTLFGYLVESNKHCLESFE
jgi:hypothetical protein